MVEKNCDTCIQRFLQAHLAHQDLQRLIIFDGNRLSVHTLVGRQQVVEQQRKTRDADWLDSLTSKFSRYNNKIELATKKMWEYSWVSEIVSENIRPGLEHKILETGKNFTCDF